MSTKNQPMVTSRTAGALDIRNFIGSLLGLYGIILTLMGVFGDAELPKTGGVNANLWAGILLLIGAAIFLGWAKLRPVTMPQKVDGADAPRTGH